MPSTCARENAVGMANASIVHHNVVRAPAVAGTWYPGTAHALAAAVDGYLSRASSPRLRAVTALVAPHAGLIYSGPVAAHAYRQLQGRSIDLVVPHGELVCFLGPSGCGKTTLLRIIAGLERQTRGTILQNGRDISNAAPAARD